MRLTDEQIKAFQTTLHDYYRRHGRHDLPWRSYTDSYRVVVSELMLQQTQVNRVIPKYTAFLDRFPDVRTLAAANLGEVLKTWQGLGYNRRAKYLWQAAQQVVNEYDGQFPDTAEGLSSLPGIGKNTAGAVQAYAHNQPAIFVETNIRSVIIHHFFADRTDIADTEIVNILNQILNREAPRIFYWAMMDYGTFLKQTAGNNINRSRHYVRQSPFNGSKRQVRGAVLRLLSERGYPAEALAMNISDERLIAVLGELEDEGMVARTDGVYHLA